MSPIDEYSPPFCAFGSWFALPLGGESIAPDEEATGRGFAQYHCRKGQPVQRPYREPRQEERDLLRTWNKGANRYIRKTVDFEQLRQVVKTVDLYGMVINRSPYGSDATGTAEQGAK